MELICDDQPPVPATEETLREAFDSESGFYDMIVLSRSEGKFIQAGHWEYVARSFDTEFWHASFEAATNGRANCDDSREPDLYMVEFRDTRRRHGVNQVANRDELFRWFSVYFDGSEGWRNGLSWEEISVD